MRDDVALDEGTGKGARVRDFAVCGKTGTAEVKAGRRLIDRITWFSSFAPYESPRYAVVVMVESGGSGGGTCAPVARRIYEHLRDRERGTVAQNSN
jgi:cell division protein FtsI/penicillin-binding protein 2